MYKNIMPYSINLSPDVEPPNYHMLETRADDLAYQPCTPQQAFAIGFSAPLYGKPSFVFEQMGWLLIEITAETRTVPPAAVADALVKRIKEIEERETRKVYRKERAGLKSDVEIELLPRAFSRRTKTPVLINQRSGLVFVATGSRASAENALNLIRDALGSFPLVPYLIGVDIRSTVTRWISTTAPEGVSVGEACTLQGRQKEAARFKNGDLASDSVLAAVESGMVCTSLALAYTDAFDRVTKFTLTDELALKGIKLDDLAFDRASDQQEAADIFAGTFAVEVSAIADIYSRMGGWLSSGGAE